MFDMLTNEDLKRIKKEPDSKIKELENSLSIALEINDKFQRDNAALIKSRPLNTMDEIAYHELEAENKNLKKRAQESEGETSIVKGIGMNSPEIKDLQRKCREAGRAIIELNLKYEGSLKQVEELKANLARAKKDHQHDKMVHEKELESLTKK